MIHAEVASNRGFNSFPPASVAQDGRHYPPPEVTAARPPHSTCDRVHRRRRKHVQVTSTRIRPGLYRVTSAGRMFHVEQIRTDLDGYGVENRWWINSVDDGPDPMLDPAPTKRDALADIANLTTPTA